MSYPDNEWKIDFWIYEVFIIYLRGAINSKSHIIYDDHREIMTDLFTATFPTFCHSFRMKKSDSRAHMQLMVSATTLKTGFGSR